MKFLAALSQHDGAVLQYQHDGNGNLTVLANPFGDAHGFGYTANDQRQSLVTPTSGSYLYGYDRDRRLTGVTFPSGKRISNFYGQGVLDYSLTPEGIVDYSWECGGKVAGVFKGSESLSYTYDGKLLKTDTRAGLLNQAVSYTYNDDFQVVGVAYAGASQNYAYDNDGLLTLSEGYTISRNAQNALPERVSGGSYLESRTFNGYVEIDSNSYSVGENQVYSWTASLRDNAGRITQRVETIAGATVTLDYAYDNRGRLVEVKRDGAVTESYTYDLQGNRLSENNVPRGITRSLSYSTEDHLFTAGSGAYQYDLDGFLTSKTTGDGITTYHYSSRGELLDASLPDGRIVTYEHDPLGRPIARLVNGVIEEKFLWAGMTTLLAVYDATDSLKQRFVYADGRMPVSMTQAGQTFYLAYDQVGSLRVVADSLGSVVRQIDYDSFGNVIADSNPAFKVPFGFAGGLFDPDTGFLRFGYRDYDPATGRWSAKDPIDFDGGDSNLYGYCLGDPVNGTDPAGLVMPPVIPPGANIYSNAQQAQNMSAHQFYDAVKTGGVWDYKTRGIQYEPFGNYNYGYTGATWGWSPETLFSMGGLVHIKRNWFNYSVDTNGLPWTAIPYGDSPDDWYWINEGIRDYRNRVQMEKCH